MVACNYCYGWYCSLINEYLDKYLDSYLAVKVQGVASSCSIES